MRFFPSAIATILVVLTCPLATLRAGGIEIPSIDGDWWRIASNPDLGPLTSPKQQPVDFSVWPASDGTWQLWSCIRGTKEPGKTRLFYRWEGRTITDRDWKVVGVAMHADPERGETAGGLQAPFVFRPDGRGPYQMLYGCWTGICLQTSEDGKTFTRQPPPKGDGTTVKRFGEEPDANARDPFALKIGDLWHVYYTAHPGKRGAVYCRTTSDFATFSDAKIVAAGGQAGTHASSGECPFVIARSGSYYLFRTVHYDGKPLTHVYASTDPLDFGVNDDRCHIGILPVAAPEIVRHEGREYIACLTPELDGIRVARLKWEKRGNPGERNEKR